MQRVDNTSATATTVALAQAVRQFTPEAIGAERLERAQLLLLDALACALAGAREPAARAVLAATEPSAGNCVLLGHRQRSGPLNAVLANGAATRVLDFNDYFVGEALGEPEAGGHPSDNIPVALAIAQHCRSSGIALLAAIVLGYDIYWRLQRLMNRAGKWDGVCASGLVAPAIAGFLNRMDERRLAHALALGAARAATPSIVRRGGIGGAKTLANALVAQAGVQAALLADAGITGPLNILDDERGMKNIFGATDFSPLTQPLSGDSILRAKLKSFPCVNTAQTAAEAAIKLHPAVRQNPTGIDRIEIVMADYPMIQRQQEDADRTSPQSREAADHSFTFIVAAALLDGELGLRQFEGQRWRDPAVTELMSRMHLRRDKQWNRRAPGALPCRLRIMLSDGRELTAEAADANEVSAPVLHSKFESLLVSTTSHETRSRIVDAVMELHHSADTAALDAALITAGNTVV